MSLEQAPPEPGACRFFVVAQAKRGDHAGWLHILAHAPTLDDAWDLATRCRLECVAAADDAEGIELAIDAARNFMVVESRLWSAGGVHAGGCLRLSWDDPYPLTGLRFHGTEARADN